MGFRVTIFSQQLSPSGSGAHCSQSPCGIPETMSHCALDHSVPEAAVQGDAHPSVGLSLQEWAPIHSASKPLVGPSPKRVTSLYQAPNQESLHSQTVHDSERESAFSHSPLKGPPKYHMCRKAVGVSSFFYSALVSAIFVNPSVFDLLLPAIFVRAKVSQPHTGVHAYHSPGWGILPPQLTKALYELPSPRAMSITVTLSVFAVCPGQPLPSGKHKSAFVMQRCPKHCAFCSVGSSLPWRTHGIFNVPTQHPSHSPCLFAGFGGIPLDLRSPLFSQEPLVRPTPYTLTNVSLKSCHC